MALFDFKCFTEPNAFDECIESQFVIVKIHWAEYIFFCISRNKIYKINKDSGQKNLLFSVSHRNATGAHSLLYGGCRSSVSQVSSLFNAHVSQRRLIILRRDNRDHVICPASKKTKQKIKPIIIMPVCQSEHSVSQSVSG